MVTVRVGDAELEVSEWGAGEPVVFIQTALTADELVPLATHPALGHGYRRVVYHRRGYAGSSPATGDGSIRHDADDCRGLLAAMGIDRAHIVGYSYSGAVALQLAADAPECSHTLTLLEPPPVHTPSAPEFREVNERLFATRRAHGPVVALDEFLKLAMGPEWGDVIDARLPGARTQMERDAATFFDADLPGLLRWQFAARDAQRVRCAVLSVWGAESRSWFHEVRMLLRDWLPQSEEVVIEGADHALALADASQVAVAVSDFLGRHAMDPGSPA
jgi:3-oxoadipate enol-lactonase